MEVCRNYFGAQVQSCEMTLPGKIFSELGDVQAAQGHTAVFIRAPAILNAGPAVEVLARVTARPCQQAMETLEALDSPKAKRQRHTKGQEGAKDNQGAAQEATRDPEAREVTAHHSFLT